MKVKKFIFLLLIALGLFIGLTSCNNKVEQSNDVEVEKTVFTKYYLNYNPSEDHYYEIYMDEKENKPKAKYHNIDNSADYIYDITFIGPTHFILNEYVYYCDGYILYNCASGSYIKAKYIFSSVNKPSEKKREVSTPAPSSSSKPSSAQPSSSENR